MSSGERVDVRVGLGRGAQEERPRAHVLAAEAVAARPAQGVRARRRDGVVDQARRLAELRRVAARDDLHLAHHHLGHRQQPQARAVLLGVGVAVDLVVDAQQRAVRAEPRHAELGVLEAGDAGLQQREVVGVARDERQVLHLALVQVAPEVDLRRVHDGRVGRHRHRLGQVADLEGHVDLGRLAGAQLDAALLVLLEAGQLGRQPVGAKRQQHGAVQAALVGDDDALGSRVGVGERHGDARQHAARVVAHGALDGAVGGLRLGQGREGGDHQQQRKHGGQDTPHRETSWMGTVQVGKVSIDHGGWGHALRLAAAAARSGRTRALLAGSGLGAGGSGLGAR